MTWRNKVPDCPTSSRICNLTPRPKGLGLLAGILVVAMCQPLVTQADAGGGVQSSDPSIFSFAGFGTFGVVHSSEDNAQFTGSGFTPTGAGYGHSWSAGCRQPGRRAGDR
jgi:hypothetical protein